MPSVPPYETKKKNSPFAAIAESRAPRGFRKIGETVRRTAFDDLFKTVGWCDTAVEARRHRLRDSCSPELFHRSLPLESAATGRISLNASAMRDPGGTSQRWSTARLVKPFGCLIMRPRSSESVSREILPVMRSSARDGNRLNPQTDWMPAAISNVRVPRAEYRVPGPAALTPSCDRIAASSRERKHIASPGRKRLKLTSRQLAFSLARQSSSCRRIETGYFCSVGAVVVGVFSRSTRSNGGRRARGASADGMPSGFLKSQRC